MEQNIRDLIESYNNVLIAGWLRTVRDKSLPDRAKIELLEESMTEWLCKQTKNH